jgi:type I restriction enzyme R subunit
VQIGLTATPRQLECKEVTAEAKQDSEITANNIAYFGEPAYEYDIAQAIENGYLAACEIQKGRVNLDDTGITKAEIIARNPVDAITGQPLTPAQIDDLYERYQFEDRVLLPDRVQAMCQDLFDYMLETGGLEQKTIIFCARDRHADDVAVCMNNLYAKWCADKGKPRLEYYAFKCTAAGSGNDQLPDLRASSRSHFIATTVDLLTTGVDVPCVRNIVFFKYLKSPARDLQPIPFAAGRGGKIQIGKG